MENVIVIAGTLDGRWIIENLTKLNINIIATVTTNLGASFLKTYDRVEIREGSLNCEGMMGLIHRKKGLCVIDASHPFAEEASKNAIKACKTLNIPYLRFERKETECMDQNIIRVKDSEEAVEVLNRMEGNILLTTGSNKLHIFAKVKNFTDRVFVRVLSNSKIIEKCEQLGLNAENIIAIKGPFSEGMNIEMIKHCNASILVTKDSGDIGGSKEKISAAKKMNISIIMIKRPEIDYGSKVDSIEAVVDFVREMINQ